MVKVVRAIMRLIETLTRQAGIASGPNSRERVKETVVVVLNGRQIRQ